MGILNFFKGLWKSSPQTVTPASPYPLGEKATQFLLNTVSFYKELKPVERRQFDERVLLFIQSTDIVGQGINVDDNDCLLIAASAIIPVWSFPRWHYFNLKKVILMPDRFNHELQVGREDSRILGMVGNGSMAGKMLLSKPALHYGFINSNDRKNVGIHEFSHLIDMTDGDCDGLPLSLINHAYSAPWLDFVHQKINDIYKGKSDIDEYAATDKREFFAVATEYFFERPKLLKTRHPKLYDALERFYRQNRAEIEADVAPRRKAPCPCGSGKRYKHCCASSLTA